MSTKINNSLEKPKNGNNRHRKEKSRNPRGTVLTEVQVPGVKAGGRGRKSNRPGNSDQGSTRHGATHKQQKHRAPDQLGDRNHSSPAGHSGVDATALRSKISERQATAMLERIAKDHLINNVNAILKVDDEIRAFGKYSIRQADNHYEIYRGATLVSEPKSRQVALSWCIADKYNKTQLAQELLFFDQELERRHNEIEYYEHTLKVTADSVKKYVVSDRLRQARAQQKHLTERLEECVNSAKYWQQKGFKDETARIGIKNQSTTKPESI